MFCSRAQLRFFLMNSSFLSYAAGLCPAELIIRLHKWIGLVTLSHFRYWLKQSIDLPWATIEFERRKRYE
jgi:hypothetical protein